MSPEPIKKTKKLETKKEKRTSLFIKFLVNLNSLAFQELTRELCFFADPKRRFEVCKIERSYIRNRIERFALPLAVRTRLRKTLTLRRYIFSSFIETAGGNLPRSGSNWPEMANACKTACFGT